METLFFSRLHSTGCDERGHVTSYFQMEMQHHVEEGNRIVTSNQRENTTTSLDSKQTQFSKISAGRDFMRINCALHGVENTCILQLYFVEVFKMLLSFSEKLRWKCSNWKVAGLRIKPVSFFVFFTNCTTVPHTHPQKDTGQEKTNFYLQTVKAETWCMFEKHSDEFFLYKGESQVNGSKQDESDSVHWRVTIYSACCSPSGCAALENATYAGTVFFPI